MQEELIEMLEEIIQYVEVWNAHDQGIIDKAEALIEKAKNSAKEPDVPQGWKLVPVEPTTEMKAAGINIEVYSEVSDSIGALTWAEVDAIYRAMLAATPAAPSQEPGTCAQCKKPYRNGANTKGCPKCAPGLVVPESEFQKSISAQAPGTLTDEEKWSEFENRFIDAMREKEQVK